MYKYFEDYILEFNRKLDEIKKKNYIVVWGASLVLDCLYKESNLINIDVKEIVDERFEGIVYGKYVKKKNDINWNEVDCLIIAASFATTDIISDSKRLGYNNTIITVPIDNKPIYDVLKKSEVEISDQYKDVVKRNLKFKNTGNGKRLFILGNGPSINEVDLKPLKDEEVMVVNNFYTHKDFDIINPKYYVIPQVHNFNKDTDKINREFYAGIAKGTENFREIEFFYDVSSKNIIEGMEVYDNRNVNYFYLEYRIPFSKYENVDLTKKIIMGGSVIIDALQVGMYMGYDEIYLLGVEHNILQERKYKHFYRTGTVKSLDSDTDRNDNITTPYYQLLEENALLWQQYRKIKEISEVINVKIFNSTRNSMLDVFEGREFEEVINAN